MKHEDDTRLDGKAPYEPPCIEETAPFEQLRLGCALADEYCSETLGGPVDSS